MYQRQQDQLRRRKFQNFPDMGKTLELVRFAIEIPEKTDAQSKLGNELVEMAYSNQPVLSIVEKAKTAHRLKPGCLHEIMAPELADRILNF